MTIWITRVPDEERPPAREGALSGLRLAVKDNIDVAGLPTTAGCPEFATTPASDAPVVARLRAAGAVVAGKTVMDQFATGLTGTRAPTGPVACVADPRVIAGGSSSGSAVAVARGEADIALGTDTAGSGRVPAAMNGIVGLKPTRGLISVDGVVPACLSIDCVSIFARTCADALLTLSVAAEPPGPAERGAPREARADLVRLAAPRIGVPPASQLTFGDDESAALFASAVERLRALGATLVEIDLRPFRAAGDLLYGGPWVAERLAAVGGFIRDNPDATLDPVVRAVILGAEGIDAVAAYRGRYALDALVREAAPQWERMDALIVPAVPSAPTIDEVAADPHGVNAALGTYTNFVNLMDLCALALPAGRRASGVPFGVQLIAPAFSDGLLCALGARLERRTVRLAVVGAHLRGQPLNHQLTARGARFVAATRTSADYRLHRLPDTVPPKPGLVRAPGPGAAPIEVEVWDLGEAEFGSFTAEVPPPLAIGTVRLEDGADVAGFVCEPGALAGAEEITRHGGWRAFLAS
jgi:allophanate hydrolase